MKRREFLVVSSLGAANALLGCAVPGSHGQRSLFEILLAQNDDAVSEMLPRQQRDKSHPAVGGLPDRYEVYHPGSACGLILTCAVGYVSPQSRFFRSPELLDRMLLAARFLLGSQHDNGTIDLLTTNFHSTPDTGFVMEWMCLATSLLREAEKSWTGSVAPVIAELDRFVLRAADALTVGGIHTPNHRWVVCMALARANRLHPNPRYVARIDEWLGEGVDIDGDGQFTERSTSVYSPLTDRCLITVARLLDRPALLEPVRRNLEMTLFYLHADGEVVTEGSRRQDQYRSGSLAPYYYPYRFMAQRDGNGRFAAAARWIEATVAHRLTRDAGFFVESQALRKRMPSDARLPTDYEKHFRHSDLVRIRRGLVSATLLAQNSTLFSLHNGRAAVVVRFASAFFGKGQFTGANLRKDGRSWVMDQKLEGPYWQPLAASRRTGDNDWAKTDRTTRERSEVQRLHSTVRLRETSGVFELQIVIEGTARVPVAIELGFRKGGALSGHGLSKVSGPTASWLLESGTGRFEFGADAIEFGPGRREHAWTGLRGALPKLDADSVYLTGFTPFRATLTFS
jgi:hypothetical protein